MRNLLAAFLMAALVFGPAAPVRSQEAPTAASPFTPDFDAFVAQAMKQWNVPGTAIAIVRDGHTYLKGYGVRSIDAPQDKVDAQTLFAIGSSSKAFTAAGLGMLVDEHKITWDDRLTDDLPGFQMYDPWVTREITVRDALAHRSGLVGGDALWYGSDLTREQIIQRIRYLPPTYSFRSTFYYNNLMVLVAGQVLAVKSGMTWDAFIHDRFFVPLEMTSSSTSISALSGQSNVAQPHEEVDGKVRVVPYRRIDNISPAGGINSNVTDMSHWVEMLLANGVYKGHRLLSESTIAQLFSPQMIMPVEIPWTFFAPKSNFLDYGLNWILFDYHGHKGIQHGGNIDGMTAMVALVPDMHFGIVILTNKGDDFVTSAVLYRAMDQALGLPPQDWSATFYTMYSGFLEKAKAAQAAVLSKRVKGTHPSLALEKYAGTYHNNLYGDAVVSGGSNGLRFQLLGSHGRLEHWNYDTFRLIGDDPLAGASTTLVTFDLGATGSVTSLHVAGDPNMVFPRAAAATPQK